MKNFLLVDLKVVLMKCLLVEVAPKSSDDIFNDCGPFTHNITRKSK